MAVTQTEVTADLKEYHVYFQLSDVTGSGLGVEKSWYKYEGGAFKAITNDALNTELKSIEPALVYNDGMTYYWLDIKHLGTPGSDTEFGIVRNHIYKVNISSITGFGTPVYDPTQKYITPEKPKDLSTYVSASINILSWRLVTNSYDI